MAIARLSEDLINQIAAGEVVERPAHLLKELVENSIDAGATEIEVDLADGARFIKVKDNGSGIESAELPLALERHATSKIKNVEDLWSIQSFGFRGEALASAASVSKLTLISRTAKQDVGATLRVEYGRRGEVEKIGSAVGTTVIIDKLFENVPARRKFLKSDSAEIAQAKSVMRALAMANPHVAMRVKVQDSLIFYWPQADSRFERVKAVLEETEMFESFAEVGAMKAQVIACSPNVTYPQSKKIYIFVKNRPVQDRSLQTAVIDAYRTVLMHGKFPIGAVFIECPADEVDVNIHPTKSQVKFRDAGIAFRAVHRATREMVLHSPWLKNLLGRVSDQSVTSVIQNEVVEFQQSLPESFKTPEFTRTQFKQNSSWKKSLVEAANGEVANISEETKPVTTAAPIARAFGYQWQSLQILGQANLTYILCQNERAMIIVDQHAAHERVNFERLMQGFHAKRFEVQTFLLPITIDMEEHLLEKMIPHFPELEERLGLGLDQIGPSTMAVRAAPAMIKEDSLAEALTKTAEEIYERGESFVLEKFVGEIFATMACHSSVRAGQALSVEEMRSLLLQMDEFSMSSFCPHGRPVYVEYPFAQLERDFGRTV